MLQANQRIIEFLVLIAFSLITPGLIYLVKDNNPDKEFKMYFGL
jgi:hypothetical protein